MAFSATFLLEDDDTSTINNGDDDGRLNKLLVTTWPNCVRQLGPYVELNSPLVNSNILGLFSPPSFSW